MSEQTLPAERADYGLDAPGVMRNLFLIGAALLLVGVALLVYSLPRFGLLEAIVSTIGTAMLISSLTFFLGGSMMIFSSRSGKMHARDRLLNDLQLKGNETVLDVGCGRGLLLLGAACRLPHGRAVGIDLWSQEDQSNNNLEATLANARAEGVADRIELHTGDMRKMPFSDASFDAVIANLSIHNIYSRDGRREAVSEIVRVLKPGGQVSLMDFQHVKQYAEDLQAAGLQQVKISGLIFWIYPPARIATGRK